MDDIDLVVRAHELAISDAQYTLNDYKEMLKEEKRMSKEEMMPTTLFCEECGITEATPSFGQQYCRYCGTKFKISHGFMRKETKNERDNK